MSPFPTPCKGKSKNQPFAPTFALTGRGRLYADTQGVALGYELAALSGRSRRRFELIEFLQRGCGLRRSSLVGLRRRNNELNELTNCRAAWVRGIAPFRGAVASLPTLIFLYFEHPNSRRGNTLFVLQHFALESQHSQGVECQGLHLVFTWIEIDRGQEADAMSQARRDIFGMCDATRNENAIDFPT